MINSHGSDSVVFIFFFETVIETCINMFRCNDIMRHALSRTGRPGQHLPRSTTNGTPSMSP